MRAARPQIRFAVGVLLAAALGAWLSHRFVDQATRFETADITRRRAVVAVQGLAELAGRVAADGDALRRGVRDWQAKVAGVSQARVVLIAGAQLAASSSTTATAAGDEAPRRLKREEKPSYDRAQRLVNAVRENREAEEGRKPELEVAPAVTGRRLSLAAPLLVAGEEGGAAEPTGMVEVETAELPPAPGEPVWPYLLAVLAPLALFAAGSVLLRERRALLAGLAVTAVVASLAVLLVRGGQQVAGARHGAAQAVADEARVQASLLGALAPGAAVLPGRWDSDVYRKPLGLLTDAGEVDAAAIAKAGAVRDGALRKSVLAGDALALAVLLLVGLGAMNRLGSTLWTHRRAYAYVAPAVLGVMVLVFFPFLYAIALSFTNSNIYNTSQPLSELWVGFQNYLTIIGDFEIVKHGEAGSVVNYLNFYWTLGFTIIWTVTNVAIGVSSGLFLALILNTKGLAARSLYRVLLILPWAMPNYITALIWKGMFHRQFGVINQVFQIFGLPAVSWFESPVSSFLTALATNAWLSFPFMMVVSLGALQSIPSDLYEAARVDGANRWQAFRAITLPSLRPALVPAVIISVVWTFNMFNIIYLVTAGEPGGATEILVTQAYKFAFERYRYGYAAAYSTIIFIILLGYGMVQNRVSKGTEA